MQMGGSAPLPPKRMSRIPGHLTVDGGHTEALTPSATPRALMPTPHFNNSVPPHAHTKTKDTRPPSPPGLPPEVADRFPVVWRGSVNLKNQRVPVRLHELDARLHELDANCHSLAQQLPHSVTVTQRMKLEEEQIKMFSEELRTHNGRHRTLLGHADDEGEGMSGISSVSAAGASAGSSVSGLKFKTHLVKYLNEKSVAGVVQLDGHESEWDRLYFFPPGAFANMCITQKVPDLDMSTRESYVLVVLLPKA